VPSQLTTKLEDGVLDVLLHGGAANEIGLAMVAELEDVVRSFDARVRAMVIRSE